MISENNDKLQQDVTVGGTLMEDRIIANKKTYSGRN